MVRFNVYHYSHSMFMTDSIITADIDRGSTENSYMTQIWSQNETAILTEAMSIRPVGVSHI